ncbi:MAG: hypothetical protein ACMXYG_05330 [Candidatus Woesearchaeota archaeon]
MTEKSEFTIDKVLTMSAEAYMRSRDLPGDAYRFVGVHTSSVRSVDVMAEFVKCVPKKATVVVDYQMTPLFANGIDRMVMASGTAIIIDTSAYRGGG